MTKHQIFLTISDSLLGCAIVFNAYAVWRNRKHLLWMRENRKQLERFQNDKYPALVSALESMAMVVCPMCAIASGAALVDMGSDVVDADAETGGEHAVRLRGGGASTALCLAASIRADARAIFTEGFNENLATTEAKTECQKSATK